MEAAEEEEEEEESLAYTLVAAQKRRKKSVAEVTHRPVKVAVGNPSHLRAIFNFVTIDLGITGTPKTEAILPRRENFSSRNRTARCTCLTSASRLPPPPLHTRVRPLAPIPQAHASGCDARVRALTLARRR